MPVIADENLKRIARKLAIRFNRPAEFDTPPDRVAATTLREALDLIGDLTLFDVAYLLEIAQTVYPSWRCVLEDEGSG